MTNEARMSNDEVFSCFVIDSSLVIGASSFWANI
jgi:hypothetical protein